MNLADLIPPQYRLVLAIVAVLVGLGAAAAGGALVQSWRMGEQMATLHAEHQTQLRVTAETHAAVILQQQADRLALEARLTDLDNNSTEDLTHAKDENERLRRLYGAADDERKRLRIEVVVARNDATVSAATVAGSVGDATSVELSPAAGSAVWDIRGGMKADQAKIAYLQGYVCLIKPDAPGCGKRN
ncbi:lysis system i-spanin subunit Rz [Stutzerimonas stutzeri]|uniref:lysis system i-spanin subunit Rz n=1 Tax=Stutzerimonas stutzeri TaxID=316 RepID=UPI00210E0051|nr:lysis system i-spanin subunit Rz [Stutzerimonas stutzeri]MCQ4257490.1 lysis protein [Stutzerimonas stutzeri]